MKTSLLACLIVFTVGVINSTPVHAESAGITTDSGFVITPLITIGAKNDDNIFSQPTDVTESLIYTVAPSVNFLLDDGVNQYEFDLGIESGTFDDSSDDDYLDGYVAFNGHIEPSSTSRWDLSAAYNMVTEPRGTGITEGISDFLPEPLTYDTQAAGASFEYGALSTQARVAFNVNYFNKSYSNFEALTLIRNYDSFLAGASFYYSTNSKTDLFLEISQDAITYEAIDGTGISRDSDDSRALLGIKWEATALTSGSIKVGQQQKKFADSAREDFEGLSWAVGIDWQPLTYSLVSFKSSRTARDPNVEGDYINETLFGINWQHNWTEKFSSNFELSSIEEDYSGVAVARVDDTLTFDVSFNFELARWLEISVFGQLIDKESTRADILFDKTVVGINATFSL